MAIGAKSTEIRRVLRGAKGEEEPVVVAQRFLNIFRQLHIFDEPKKQEFRQMILALPPEIRGMFDALPGGSLLQEYVDDLEQSEGVVREKMSAASSELDSEISKAKILATAMAEAQMQLQMQHQQTQAQAILTPQSQQTSQEDGLQNKLREIKEELISAKKSNDFVKIAELQREFLEVQGSLSPEAKAPPVAESSPKVAETPKEAVSDAPQVVYASPSSEALEFSKVMSKAQLEMIQALKESNIERKNETLALSRMLTESQNKIAELLSSSNEVRRTETMEITKALTQSQLEVAKMIISHNNVNANANNNANNIQINTAPVMPAGGAMGFLENSAAIETIIKAQSEIFREMAHTQTQELTGIISSALRESNQLSTQSLIDAFERMQQENLKYIKILSENQSRNDYEEDDDSYDESENQVDFSMIAEDIFPKKKKKKKNRNKNKKSVPEVVSTPQEWEYVEEFSARPQEEEWEYVEEVSTEPQEEEWEYVEEVSAEPQEEEWEYVEEEVETVSDSTPIPTPAIEVAATEDWDWEYEEIEKPTNAPGDFDELFSSKDESEILDILSSEKSEELFFEPDAEMPKFSDASTSSIFEEVVEPQVLRFEESAVLENDIFDKSTEEDDEFEALFANIEFKSPKSRNEPVFEAPFVETLEDEPAEEVQTEELFETPTLEEADFLEFEAPVPFPEAEIEVEVEAEPEAVFEPETENEPEFVAIDAQSPTEDELEWEYEEVEEEEAPEPIAMEAQVVSEEEEWEWEYEEVEEEAPEPVAIEAQVVSEEEEWEWEYEEVEEETPEPVAIETQTVSEEEEWEWEYEEVEEDDKIVDVDIQAEISSPVALDPYSKQPIDENDTEVNALFAEDLFFQKDVFIDSKKENKSENLLNDYNPELLIEDLLEKDDKNEPYVLK